LSYFETNTNRTNGAGGGVSFAAINLGTTDVTGTLSSANGGTGLASYSAGDLLYATSATTLTRLAAGSAGNILSINSSTLPYWTSNGLPNNSIPIFQVRLATTENIPLAGTPTIDGTATAVGDRILVKNQNIASENGVYVITTGPWDRATEMDSWTETLGYQTQVTEGSAWAGITYSSSTDINAGTLLGTTPINWNAIGSGNPMMANTANGYQALTGVTSGSRNSASGFQALYANNTGSFNTAIGYQALYNNTTANYNTAVGHQTLLSNTTGNYNSASGHQAMILNTTGAYNTATGMQALALNTTGSFNSAYGHKALYSNTTANGNTANGYLALNKNTTGYSNTAHGAQALYLNTTGFYNTAIGYMTLTANTTGSYNTATGLQTLFTNTNGSNNTGNGYAALALNTTGNNNTAYGLQALATNTTGSRNTADGVNALFFNQTKSESTAIGYRSQYYSDSVTTGTSYNTSIGAYSLYGATSATLNAGIMNTAIGHSALMGMITGSGNTGIGYNAGSAITTGSNNVIIGSNTGTTIATLSNYILITDGAGNERIRVDSNGNVGIGTTSPNALLDVAGTLRATTLCDSTGTNCKTISDGWSITYGTIANTALQGNQTLSGDVTGAVGTTTVAKLQNRTLASTAPTTGAFLKWNATQWEPFQVPNCVGNNYALHYTSASDSWSCDLINDTTKLALTGGTLTGGLTLNAGTLGYLITSGQIVSTGSTNNSSNTTFNFNNGNAQYTSATCQAMTLQNMVDGGSYSITVKNTSGSCTFTSSGDTVHYAGGVTTIPISSHTIFSFLKMGTDVYVTWVNF
jgi:hypothetical protein